MEKKIRFLLVALCLLVSTAIHAQDVTVNGLAYLINNDTATVYGLDPYGQSDIVIPAKITVNGITYPVTRIRRGAFNGTWIASVVFPNSIKSIENEAFTSCNLTSINIPKSVTSLGDRVFYGCNYLSTITVEKGNPVYDSRDNCNAIIRTKDKALIFGCKNTVIPNSVTSIGESAFYGCSGLSSITIPSNVDSIGSMAFYDCM